MCAKALLDSNPRPTHEEVRQAMSGNLCRCTGYDRIEKAIFMAADIVVKYAEGKED